MCFRGAADKQARVVSGINISCKVPGAHVFRLAASRCPMRLRQPVCSWHPWLLLALTSHFVSLPDCEFFLASVLTAEGIVWAVSFATDAISQCAGSLNLQAVPRLCKYTGNYYVTALTLHSEEDEEGEVALI